MTALLIGTHRPLLMKGLAVAIGGPHPTWLLAFARSLPEAAHQLSLRTVALAIVDVAMEGMRNGRSVQSLAGEHPSTRLILLATTQWIDRHWQECSAVAADCIAETDPTERWQTAVQSILANAGDLAPAVEPIACPADRTDGAGAGMPLTGRQSEVIRLLSEGNSVKQIARRLGISPGTVKTHLGLAYTTLGAHNRVEAVLRAQGFHPQPQSWEGMDQAPVLQSAH